MGLAVGDHEVLRGRRRGEPGAGPPVQGVQPAAYRPGGPGQEFPGRLGERAAGPGPAQLAQGQLQVIGPGQLHLAPLQPDRRRVHAVQRGQHRDQLVEVGRGQGLVPLAGGPVQEREHRDRMRVAERPQGLAVQRRNRGRHEPESDLAAQGHGGVQRRAQPREHGRPGPAQPALVVQVVDRDEPLLPRAARHHPVVAPAADGCVPQRLGGQAPAVGQGVHQVSFGNSRGPVPHEGSRYGGRPATSQPNYGWPVPKAALWAARSSLGPTRARCRPPGSRRPPRRCPGR